MKFVLNKLKFRDVLFVSLNISYGTAFTFDFADSHILSHRQNIHENYTTL